MPLSFTALLLLSAVAADSPAKPEKAAMVYYTGKVQGVGFRATAVEIAKDYPVSGWVKNLKDGRVQLLAEGPADAVDKFLAAIRSHWQGNIDKEDIQPQTPTDKYQTFEIAQ